MSHRGRRLWLVRHGYRQDYSQPQWPRTAQYPYDPPLSKNGLLQAQDLIKAFAQICPDHVFVSPYLRTLQTVKPLAHAYGLSVKVEDGIGEICRAQTLSPLSLSSPQRQRLVPQINPSYSAYFIPRERESAQMAMQRSAQTVQHLLSQIEGNLLLVTHESPLRGIVKALAPHSQSIRCSFAGVTELTFNDGWHLIRNGDVEHLSSPTTPIRFLYDYARRRLVQPWRGQR